MKICFITSSRADYGLLSILMRLINEDKNFTFQLIVINSHLEKNHFSVSNEIIKDKFKINFLLDIKIKKNDIQNVCNSVGLVISEISKKLKILKSDLIILLGDRYEIFAACSAAYIHQIPICHLHGGELTKGSIDDSFRHAITKMSNIHLVANKHYAKRVIQLGENPKTVFVVGGFGVDLIKKNKLLQKKEIEKNLNFNFGKKNILVTYHPETIINSNNKKSFSEVLKALNYLKEYKIIFTKANADAEGSIINNLIEKYVKKNKKRCVLLSSMGQLNYLSTLNIVDYVIGNSSSGLTEAPVLKTITINVGDRQGYRMKALSVIDVKNNYKSILSGVKKANTKYFKKLIKGNVSLYGNAGASFKAYNILKNLKKKNLIKYKFYDLKNEK